MTTESTILGLLGKEQGGNVTQASQGEAKRKAAGNPGSLNGSLSGHSAQQLSSTTTTLGTTTLQAWLDAGTISATNSSSATTITAVQLKRTDSASSAGSLAPSQNLQASTSAPQPQSASNSSLTISASGPVLLQQQSTGQLPSGPALLQQQSTGQLSKWTSAVPVETVARIRVRQPQSLEDCQLQLREHAENSRVLTMLKLFVQTANRFPEQWQLNWNNTFATNVLQTLASTHPRIQKRPPGDEKEIKSLLETHVPYEDADSEACRVQCVDILKTVQIPAGVARLAAQYLSGSKELSAVICTLSVAAIDTTEGPNYPSYHHLTNQLAPCQILFQLEPWKTHLKPYHHKYVELIPLIRTNIWYLNDLIDKGDNENYFKYLTDNEEEFNQRHRETTAIATAPQTIAATHLSSTTQQQQQQQ